MANSDSEKQETHWDDCWRVHLPCAVVRIEELTTQVGAGLTAHSRDAMADMLAEAQTVTDAQAARIAALESRIAEMEDDRQQAAWEREEADRG